MTARSLNKERSEPMKEVTPFYQAIDDPAASGRRITHKKIMGTLCSYAPEELIYAAGYHPMRLFSSKTDNHLARNHLQTYCCSVVQGILEDSLAGRLDFLHGTVFVHTCDSMQRLSDIWRLKGQYPFFTDVILPAKMHTPSAQTYMAAVLERCKTDLETDTGRPVTSRALADAIQIYNRIRKNLAQIYALKSRYPAVLQNKDLLALVKGSMVMDRQEAAGHLDKVILRLASAVPEAKDAPISPAKRLILSGSVCDMPGLYDLFQDTGAAVVGDDLCTGSRWFEGLISEDMEPMAAITLRYAKRLVCPAKHRGLDTRAQHLVDQARQVKADGVVFVLLKFCDPHAFDYPYIKARLDDAGIKSLVLELDDSQDSQGQLTTRIETFIHMI
jgi:bcr-type benzoyl-CoA reductase subunit C